MYKTIVNHERGIMNKELTLDFITFTVGRTYSNRKFTYTVNDIKGTDLLVTTSTGFHRTLNAAIQARIIKHIQLGV